MPRTSDRVQHPKSGRSPLRIFLTQGLQPAGFLPVSLILVLLLISSCQPQVPPEDGDPWAFLSPSAHDDALPGVRVNQVGGTIRLAGPSQYGPIFQDLIGAMTRQGFSGSLEYVTDQAPDVMAGIFSPFIPQTIEEGETQEEPQAIQAEPSPLVFILGNEAQVLVTSQQNETFQDVFLQEIPSLLALERHWQDVRSQWPEQPIHRFFPHIQSEGFEYLSQTFFESDRDELLGGSHVQFSRDPGVLAAALGSNAHGVGVFDYSQFILNAEGLKLVSVEGMVPGTNGYSLNYPLLREIHLAVPPQVLFEDPALGAFVLTALQKDRQFWTDRGVIPPGELQIQHNLGEWNRGWLWKNQTQTSQENNSP